MRAHMMSRCFMASFYNIFKLYLELFFFVVGFLVLVLSTVGVWSLDLVFNLRLDPHLSNILNITQGAEINRTI